MNFSLAILYAPGGRRPLSIARISDRELLTVAAEQAIVEAEAAATRLMERDPTLGILQREEASKLKRILGRLLPDSGSKPTASVM